MQLEPSDLARLIEAIRSLEAAVDKLHHDVEELCADEDAQD